MKPQAINTLGVLLAEGYSLTAHCDQDGCRHADDLDLAMLADRLGRDFVVIGDPNPLAARLKCARCGGKRIGLVLSPPNGYQAR